MKNLKYVKLFESFVNEELSPELKKKTYDEMIKIASDPTAIDHAVRRQQADFVQNTLSPEVEKLRKELEEHAKRILEENKIKDPDSSFKPTGGGNVSVKIDDYGLSNGIVHLNVLSQFASVFSLSICKDRYEKQRQTFGMKKDFFGDRAFINTLKKLIVQVQKDEIPGDELEVPVQPQSVTPEGSLDATRY
jgi:hypothetical protein